MTLLATQRAMRHLVQLQNEAGNWQGPGDANSIPKSGLTRPGLNASRNRRREDQGNDRQGTEETTARDAGSRVGTWDTALAIQTLLVRPDAALEHAHTLRDGYRRLLAMQLTEESSAAGDATRAPTRGGRCRDEYSQQPSIGDCAAEALVALIACHAVPGLIPSAQHIAASYLSAAMQALLSRQNRDGGFGSFERHRHRNVLENLNPAAMCRRHVTERSTIAGTASTLRAVCALSRAYPTLVDHRMLTARARARRFLLRGQQPCGAWAAWRDSHLLRGTQCAVDALRADGFTPAHPALRGAAQWLQATQKSDGGWGEHVCGDVADGQVANRYSLVSSTSWAVLALLAAQGHVSLAAECGVDWLLLHQQADGDWPRDAVDDWFYQSHFPARALACAMQHGYG